jgi:hypothetical protein
LIKHVVFILNPNAKEQKMGQAKARQAEINKLKNASTTILEAVRKTASLAIAKGVRLNDEGIFNDEDCVFYQMPAQDLISKGYPYRALLEALDAHDLIVQQSTGVDFSKYNGDYSLLFNRDNFAADMNSVPEQLRMESAILNGINGSYSMKGLNPTFQVQFC